MTDNFVLSIDPGLSSGVALIGYNEGGLWLQRAWQFGGGVRGLIEWVEDHIEEMPQYGKELGPRGDESPPWSVFLDLEGTVITEKFTARNTQGFSYRTEALEPLRCEGALIALGLMPDYTVSEKRWRDPGLQYLVGGGGKADKKKRQHKFLKDSGFYRTGKDLGTPDADDFRSAAAHGLAYLAKELKHKPTFELMTGWVENNG